MKQLELPFDPPSRCASEKDTQRIKEQYPNRSEQAKQILKILNDIVIGKVK